VTRFIYLSAAIAVLAYLGLCAVMFIWQRSLLYFPQPRGYATPQSTLTLAVAGAELVISVRPADGDDAGMMTFASIIMELKRPPAIMIAAGPPCSNPYRKIAG